MTARQPAAADADRGRATHQRRLTSLRFVAAVVTVATLGLTMYLTDSIVTLHREAVVVNAEWVSKQTALTELWTLAARVNAPGNDVFQSRRASDEAARMRAARLEFDRHVETVRRGLLAHEDPALAAPLLAHVGAVERAMEAMTLEADRTFADFQRGQLAEAASRMASMDREYAALLSAVGDLKLEAGAVQRRIFDSQLAAVRKLQALEYTVGGLMLLFVGGALRYSNQVSAALRRRARERDAAAAELQESEARYRDLFDNASDLIQAVGPDGRFLYVNRAWREALGYSPEEAAGLTFLDVIHPDERDHCQALFASILAGEPLDKVETAIVTRDGRRIQVEGVVNSRFDGGRFVNTRGIFRDVTERRAVEKMKQEFVATVSHELRTPLTSIRGSLGLLSGGALGDLPDEAREVIAIAERNTLRLIRLINDILDLERLEGGKLELRLADEPMAGLLARAAEGVQAAAVPRRIAIEAAPTTARVHADGDRVVQVLVNLLGNAIKFSPDGGRVTTSAEETPVGVEVRVTDHGRGIPAAQREAIFERFQQVEASDAREKGGSGLGLAICRAIVEQHGGRIGVESREGRGSTFWFRLPGPAARAAAPAGDQLLTALSSLPAAEGEDVLIVDDDEALLGVMTRQLLEDGIPTRVATTVEAAMGALRESRPGLLILDLGLPDGDGYGVVATLRKDEALSAMPLLVYTARDLSEADRARLRLGPTVFLIKSRSTDAEFHAAVARLLAEGHGEGAPAVHAEAGA